MADTIPEAGSLVEAAAQAAASGDYSSAERLLREAARIQELRLGPEHPDVANTLNNLAIVCEIRQKPEEAERCYRRAFAIATAAFGPNHPFAVTSGNNLKAFCQAHGKAVDLVTLDLVTPPGPSLGPEAPGSVAASASPPAEGSAAAVPSRAVRSGFSRSLQIGSLAALVLVLGLVMVSMACPVGLFGGKSTGVQQPSSTSAPESVSAAPTAGATAEGSRSSGATAERSGVTAEGNGGADSAAETARGRTIPGALPRVSDALFCKTLATRTEAGRPASWHCEPVKAPAQAGALSFYTRIKSPKDTTVRHLWYQGDRLRQSVELQVRANLSSGYRTFSRFTVSSAAGSNWRVELRTDKGVLLHEERIAVR